MRSLALGLLLSAFSMATGTSEDYATRAMKVDFELEMQRDGFSESQIRIIKIMAHAITLNEICERQPLDDLADYISKDSKLPIKILVRQATKYAAIDIHYMKQNIGDALRFCEAQRKAKEEAKTDRGAK